MKAKYIIGIIVIAILAGAGIGLKMFFKPHAEISKLNIDFQINAPDLMNEFQQDETAATTKYSEKVLEISGKLVAKNKLENGTNILVLEDEMQGISCQLDSTWAKSNQPAIQELQTGQPVKVKGICKGYLMEIKVSPAVIVK
jgi:hypothetical protein